MVDFLFSNPLCGADLNTLDWLTVHALDNVVATSSFIKYTRAAGCIGTLQREMVPKPWPHPHQVFYVRCGQREGNGAGKTSLAVSPLNDL